METTAAGRRDQSLARTVGALYLVVIICAGFAEGYVRSTLIEPGDAATTSANILANETVFRLGMAADLVAFMADAAMAVLLYVLLRPIGPVLALVAAAFRLIAHPAIASVNLINHLDALAVLRSVGDSSALDPAALQAMAMLSLDAHRLGYMVAGAFFGVHMVLLGVLLVRSDRFPRVLGMLLGAAGVAYLAESFTYIVAPAGAGAAAAVLVPTAGIAEVSFCLWLLLRGVRSQPGVTDAGAAGR
ncbi:MAG: DUF4386 domain-containing protein [Acidobacteria bacterium]|nr:DUF4386 domain-containing protein [Acidobacteriota bacterium]